MTATAVMPTKEIETTLQSEDWIYLCVGPNVWGKGFTVDQAQSACRLKARDPFILFACADPWAYIDGMGSICYHPREGKQTYVKVAERLPAKSKR